MRTTVTFEPDVAAALERLRKERNVGVSEAVNALVRQGLAAKKAPAPFVQHTSAGHTRVDVTNVAEVIDLIEGPEAR